MTPPLRLICKQKQIIFFLILLKNIQKYLFWFYRGYANPPWEIF